jgi:hypothetical protein
MTRKSKREIEQAVEDLAEETATEPRVVWEDADTGEWYVDPDLTDGPLEKATTDPLCVITERVVETDWERGSA